MQNSKWAMAGLVLASVAVGGAGGYTISERQMEDLVDTARKLSRQIQEVAKEFDERDVMPSATDRRRFRDAMDEAKTLVGSHGHGGAGERGILGELRRIQHQGNGGGGIEPQLQTLELTGFYVVGDKEDRDQSTASASHRSQCDAVETKLRQLFGSGFDVFICGDVKNVSPFANISYYRYASVPKVSVRYRSSNPLRSLPAGDVAGTVEDKDAYKAYASWWSTCQTFLEGQKTKYADRFVAAECGAPRNVSPYANIGYLKLISSGTVYLKD